MDSPLLSGFRKILSRWMNVEPLPFFMPDAKSQGAGDSKVITSMVSATQQPKPNVKAEAELYPGNFYIFEFFIELKLGESEHLGYPKVPIRNINTRTVQWCSKLEWSFPDPAKVRARWVDDEQRGFLTRTLVHIEDALGAEGKIGDMRLRFERVLQLGRNEVVYALYCPEKQIRLAYGFDRGAFEPSYVPPEDLKDEANG